MALFDRIVSVLAPDLGEIMARASVAMYLAEDKIPPHQVTRDQLPQLAAKLHPGLKIFVGSTRAAALADALQQLAADDGRSGA